MKNQIDLSGRQILLHSFPCFAHLPQTVSKEIVQLMQEIEYKPQEKIVVEGEWIDNIYFIVKGEVEVTKNIFRGKKKKSVPIAKLSHGEAIGLSDIGFYSTTGLRTATVIALTNILLLKLSIRNFHDCLQKYHLMSSISETANQMLRMQFIKQSLPFARLSHERLRWLSNKIEEETLPANTLLFREGEKGNKCYLIQEGEIEIFINRNNEKRLTILKKGILLGEATLITNAPRNASARTLTNTKLLVIHYKYLIELIETEKNIAHAFMTLMLDRSRPIQHPHVTLHTSVSSDSQNMTILKNHDNGHYFKLSQEGTFIWKNLDGQHTLQQITLDLADQFKIFAPNIVAGLISKLAKFGFIHNSILSEEIYYTNKSTAKKLIDYLMHLPKKRFVFSNVDQWFTYFYKKYICYLFTLPAQILLILLMVLGLIVFIVKTPQVFLFFSIQHVNLFLILGLIPLSIIKVILHELGHAFVVKAFNREIHYVGIAFSGIHTLAFVDTSDMWLARRKERLLVNLAGIYMDVLSAAISSLLLFFIPNPYLQGILWLFAVYTLLGGFRNLNPTQDTDGYFILMDILEKNRLRYHAVAWLVKKLPLCFFQPRLFIQYKAELVYWFVCVIYLLLVTTLTYIIQSFFLKAIGIVNVNLYVILSFPFLIALFSSLNILLEIRRESLE